MGIWKTETYTDYGEVHVRDKYYPDPDERCNTILRPKGRLVDQPKPPEPPPPPVPRSTDPNELVRLGNLNATEVSILEQAMTRYAKANGGLFGGNE